MCVHVTALVLQSLKGSQDVRTAWLHFMAAITGFLTGNLKEQDSEKSTLQLLVFDFKSDGTRQRKVLVLVYF